MALMDARLGHQTPTGRRLAVYAWLAGVLWFVFCRAASFGWVGPGPAFLAWTVPTLPLAFFTWWWLRRVKRAPSWPLGTAGLVVWLGLAAAALDGGDALLPAVLFKPAAAAMFLFPFLVTAHFLWAVARRRPSSPQVAA